MHHRDGPKPTAEHPPVLIKVEAADVRCRGCWSGSGEEPAGAAGWQPRSRGGERDGQELLTR